VKHVQALDNTSLNIKLALKPESARGRSHDTV
jgi:hypothetical protein